MTTEEGPPKGSLAIDTQRDKLGYVMGYVGPSMQLRPVAIGREWDADLAHVRPATDAKRQKAMRERTRALNSMSSGGIV
ncbi:hypothetical protein [Streptomyces sp. NPDC007070]|uniref:hypothetical protein n=1 Tax=Streptomyces sp. NPDC007070 TaxID=3154312 RepID=UPI003404C348